MEIERKINKLNFQCEKCRNYFSEEEIRIAEDLLAAASKLWTEDTNSRIPVECSACKETVTIAEIIFSPKRETTVEIPLKL